MVAVGTGAPPDASDTTRSPRGEDARRRILDSAIDEFAARGYEGASTRTITARAGVNLGALTYYFGGKPQLYRAALAEVAGHLDALLRPLARKADEALEDPCASAASLRAALLAMLDDFLDLLLGLTPAEWRPNWAVLISRAEFEPPEGQPWPFQVSAIAGPSSELIARLLGRPAVDEECGLLALALMGQLIVFRPVRDGSYPHMGWDRVTDGRRDAVRRVIHAMVHAILDARTAPAPA